MSVDRLKSTIFKRGGFAQTNRFNLIFTPPAATLFNLDPEAIIGNIISGSFSVKSLINDPRDISLLAQSCSLPGRQISTIDYVSDRHAIPIPYTHLDADISAKFIITNDFYIVDMFNNWQNLVFDTSNHTAGFKREISSDVLIQVLNQQDVPMYGIKLEGAIPTTISAIDLDQTNVQGTAELTVTFSYDKWVSEGTLGSTVSAVKEAAEGISNTLNKIKSFTG